LPAKSRPRLDPATLEILWNRLIAVTNEQAAALVRTSFTPVVRDSGDLSAAVFDARGRMLAQAVTGTPGHINSLATAVRHFLAAIPASELSPGDVLVTNDPWLTSGQLNDLSVVTPVFHQKHLVGFFGNTCHAIDIGGRGLSADASEVFEEGLWIPITKLYAGDRPNEELFRIISANVRAPEEVLGDLHAQVAGNEAGARRLIEYLEEFALSDLEDFGNEIIDRSEAATREAISALPDGNYQAIIRTDGLEEPITIACRVVIRGDGIEVDYAGSSSQSGQGMNVVLNYTAAYTNYALKCAVYPDVPHNEGSFRPVDVTAPEGTILNPAFPAAVAARHIVGHFLPHAVFGALADVIPNQVVAEGSGNIWLTTVRGKGKDRFVTVFFAAGGVGAGSAKDGLSTTSFPSGIATTPVEVIETTSPICVKRKELRRDSGGPGRFRGGLGQTIEFEILTGEPFVVSALSDRIRFPAQGYAGGLPGAKGHFRTSDGAELNPKVTQSLDAGMGFVLELPGGGGFYDPRERAPEDVARDVSEGLVSPSSAEAEYGVAITRTGRLRTTQANDSTARPDRMAHDPKKGRSTSGADAHPAEER
jgi:N-methylhydantoinase B